LLTLATLGIVFLTQGTETTEGSSQALNSSVQYPDNMSKSGAASTPEDLDDRGLSRFFAHFFGCQGALRVFS
jgi:hypothetical protein